jgi:hypothetical protein
VQLDVKFIAPLKGSRRRHYRFTAIDDWTRLRVLRLYDGLSQKTAIQFFDYVLQKLPFRAEQIRSRPDEGHPIGRQVHLLSVRDHVRPAVQVPPTILVGLHVFTRRGLAHRVGGAEQPRATSAAERARPEDRCRSAAAEDADRRPRRAAARSRARREALLA